MNEITPARALNGKFRSKKLDFSKPLKIFRFSDLQPEEIDELFAIGRSVPTVATGVDKDEEKEHHLIEALTAHSHGKKVTIPVPEASTEIPDYSSLYKENFKLPKYYIKCISKVEERISVPYNLDDADLEWLNQLSSGSNEPETLPLSEVHFEVMIHYLETELSPEAQTIPTFEEKDSFYSAVPFAKETSLSLDQFSRFLPQVFVYWKSKRAQSTNALIPRLKIDEYSLGYSAAASKAASSSESYICFRRREVKPTRKTRKSEASCQDKLRKLKAELEKILALLEMTCKRDKYKKKSLNLDAMIFDQIYQFELWKVKWAVKPQANIPSIKSIFDVYGYGSTVNNGLGSVKEHKMELLHDSLLSGHVTSNATATKLGFQPANMLKSCRSFAEFREKYLKAHDSLLSRHFLDSCAVGASPPNTPSAGQKCGEKAHHYREIMRKILQEMDRKAMQDKTYQDLSLYQPQPTEPTYSWRVGRSRLMHQGPYNPTQIGISTAPAAEQVLKGMVNSMNSRILGPQDILSLGNPCVYNLNSHYMNCSASLPRTFMCNLLAVLPQAFPQPAVSAGLGTANFGASNAAQTAQNSPSNAQPGVLVEVVPSANAATALSTSSIPMKHSLSVEDFKTSPNTASRQSFIGIESHSLPNFSIKKRKKEMETFPSQ